MSNTDKISNVKELRDNLLDYYLKAVNGEVDVAEVKHISQLAGKIINSASVELKYNIFFNKEASIPFLESVPKKDGNK